MTDLGLGELEAYVKKQAARSAPSADYITAQVQRLRAIGVQMDDLLKDTTWATFAAHLDTTLKADAARREEIVAALANPRLPRDEREWKNHELMILDEVVARTRLILDLPAALKERGDALGETNSA